MLNPNAQCGGSSREGLWEVLGGWRWGSQEQISSLIKEVPGSSLDRLFHQARTQENSASQSRGLTGPGWHPDLKLNGLRQHFCAGIIPAVGSRWCQHPELHTHPICALHEETWRPQCKHMWFFPQVFLQLPPVISGDKKIVWKCRGVNISLEASLIQCWWKWWINILEWVSLRCEMCLLSEVPARWESCP